MIGNRVDAINFQGVNFTVCAWWKMWYKVEGCGGSVGRAQDSNLCETDLLNLAQLLLVWLWLGVPEKMFMKTFLGLVHTGEKFSDWFMGPPIGGFIGI